LLLLLSIIYTINLPVVRPRSYRVIYYFDTPALGRRHQSFGRVNHIMGVDPNDFLMEEICSESEPIRRTINLSQREEREENREWITKREMIASTMWNDYNTQRN